MCTKTTIEELMKMKASIIPIINTLSDMGLLSDNFTVSHVRSQFDCLSQVALSRQHPGLTETAIADLTRCSHLVVQKDDEGYPIVVDPMGYEFKTKYPKSQVISISFNNMLLLHKKWISMKSITICNPYTHQERDRIFYDDLYTCNSNYIITCNFREAQLVVFEFTRESHFVKNIQFEGILDENTVICADNELDECDIHTANGIYTWRFTTNEPIFLRDEPRASTPDFSITKPYVPHQLKPEEQAKFYDGVVRLADGSSLRVSRLLLASSTKSFAKAFKQATVVSCKLFNADILRFVIQELHGVGSENYPSDTISLIQCKCRFGLPVEADLQRLFGNFIRNRLPERLGKNCSDKYFNCKNFIELVDFLKNANISIVEPINQLTEAGLLVYRDVILYIRKMMVGFLPEIIEQEYFGLSKDAISALTRTEDLSVINSNRSVQIYDSKNVEISTIRDDTYILDFTFMSNNMGHYHTVGYYKLSITFVNPYNGYVVSTIPCSGNFIYDDTHFVTFVDFRKVCVYKIYNQKKIHSQIKVNELDISSKINFYYEIAKLELRENICIFSHNKEAYAWNFTTGQVSKLFVFDLSEYNEPKAESKTPKSDSWHNRRTVQKAQKTQFHRTPKVSARPISKKRY